MSFKTPPSPEYGTDGMLPKCWIRRNDVIYLMKGGTKVFNGAGHEPYSEYFVSQLESVLGIAHIEYDFVFYHDRIVSSCKLIDEACFTRLLHNCLFFMTPYRLLLLLFISARNVNILHIII